MSADGTTFYKVIETVETRVSVANLQVSRGVSYYARVTAVGADGSESNPSSVVSFDYAE